MSQLTRAAMSGRWQSVVVLGLLGAAPALAQQVCDDASQPRSAPNARFVVDSDASLVTDTSTHLMWQRCAVGQTWHGSDCTGAATLLDWTAAQATAQQINRAGTHFYNDWRVPSLRELATIIERRCSDPRINLTVFPGTPAALFWAVTGRVRSDGSAYVLDFAAGGVGDDVKTAMHHARLVRSAP